MVITLIEALFFSLNEKIIYESLKVSDIGGSLVIHMFGAYFGLAASFFFHNKASMGNR
jgi:ammonium transporter Rh